jgi:hypothetical protein
VSLTTSTNWTPLEVSLKSLGGHIDAIREFMWMYGDDESRIEYYKHRFTRRYLLLHEDGRCFRRTESGLVEAEFHKEFERVRCLTEGEN